MAGRSGHVTEVPLHMSKPLHEQAPSEARQQTKTKTDSKREPRDSSGQVRKPNAATYGSHMANQLECSEVDFGSHPVAFAHRGALRPSTRLARCRCGASTTASNLAGDRHEATLIADLKCTSKWCNIHLIDTLRIRSTLLWKYWKSELHRMR